MYLIQSQEVEVWNRYGKRIVGMLEKAMKALSEGEKIDDYMADEWTAELEREELEENFRELNPDHPYTQEYNQKLASKD